MENYVHLAYLEVLPEYRGNRLGLKLIQVVEEWGSKQGYLGTSMVLNSTSLFSYYNSIGYERLNEAILIKTYGDRRV